MIHLSITPDDHYGFFTLFAHHASGEKEHKGDFSTMERAVSASKLLTEEGP